MRARTWIGLLALVGACRETSQDAGTAPVADTAAATDLAVAADPGGTPADVPSAEDVALDTGAPDADATLADVPDTVDAVKKDTLSEDSGPSGPFTWE